MDDLRVGRVVNIDVGATRRTDSSVAIAYPKSRGSPTRAGAGEAKALSS